jgi:hypothetical protein
MEIGPVREIDVRQEGLMALQQFLGDADVLCFSQKSGAGRFWLQQSFFERLLSRDVDLKSCLPGDIVAAQNDVRHLSLSQLLRIHADNICIAAAPVPTAQSKFLSSIGDHIDQQILNRLAGTSDLLSRSEVVGRKASEIIRSVLLAYGVYRRLDKSEEVASHWIIRVSNSAAVLDLNTCTLLRPDKASVPAYRHKSLIRPSVAVPKDRRQLHWRVEFVNDLTTICSPAGRTPVKEPRRSIRSLPFSLPDDLCKESPAAIEVELEDVANDVLPVVRNSRRIPTLLESTPLYQSIEMPEADKEGKVGQGEEPKLDARDGAAQVSDIVMANHGAYAKPEADKLVTASEYNLPEAADAQNHGSKIAIDVAIDVADHEIVSGDNKTSLPKQSVLPLSSCLTLAQAGNGGEGQQEYQIATTSAKNTPRKSSDSTTDCSEVCQQSLANSSCSSPESVLHIADSLLTSSQIRYVASMDPEDTPPTNPEMHGELPLLYDDVCRLINIIDDSELASIKLEKEFTKLSYNANPGNIQSHERSTTVDIVKGTSHLLNCSRDSSGRALGKSVPRRRMHLTAIFPKWQLFTASSIDAC